jgi:hypothetical protein
VEVCDLHLNHLSTCRSVVLVESGNRMECRQYHMIGYVIVVADEKTRLMEMER